MTKTDLKDGNINFKRILTVRNFDRFIERYGGRKSGKKMVNTKKRLTRSKTQIAAYFGVSRPKLITWMRESGYEDLIGEYKGTKKSKGE